jgi:hypothetical protein
MSMIATIEAARAFVDKHGVVMLASHGVLPSLVTAIAGEHVRGTWWSHAHGKLIFNLASQLEDYALVTKLVEGKVTFIAPRLVPAFLAIVNDARFRKMQIGKLDDDARGLLDRVMREDVHAAPKQPRDALEKSLLVRSQQVHTPSGKHVTVLRAWPKSEGMNVADALRDFAVAVRGVRTPFVL